MCMCPVLHVRTIDAPVGATGCRAIFSTFPHDGCADGGWRCKSSQGGAKREQQEYGDPPDAKAIILDTSEMTMFIKGGGLEDRDEVATGGYVLELGRMDTLG